MNETFRNWIGEDLDGFASPGTLIERYVNVARSLLESTGIFVYSTWSRERLKAEFQPKVFLIVLYMVKV